MSTKVNGETTQSQTLQHFASYPLVSDLLSMYKSNSVGAQSISFAEYLYTKLAIPLAPYLETPYNVVAPYLAKVDSLGEEGLSRVDATFPSIKTTDTTALREYAFNVAHLPLRMAGEGKSYVFKTYDDEYKKTGGNGLITSSKAVISTEMRIATEALQTIANALGSKVEEGKAELDKLRSYGTRKAQAAEAKARE